MSTPPFRAEHVGSLLRPAAWKEARLKLESRKLSAAEFAHDEKA